MIPDNDIIKYIDFCKFGAEVILKAVDHHYHRKSCGM